jgi:phage repressor protein C with HTH and peptisase S24 domain
MNTQERLITFINHLEISQGKFEKECKISNGYVNNIRTSVGKNVLEKILAKYPQLNKIWLLHGEGEMLLNADDTNPNDDNEQQEPYHKKRQKKKLTETNTNTLTYYDISASAGTASSAEILPVKKGEGVLHISDLFKGSQYAIRISGNSMMPNYPPGAIIGIREIEDKQITPGSVYVIQKSSDLWIKRLFYKDDNQNTGTVECISDNTMKFESGARTGKYFYPPFDIKIDDITKLFKVTGIYKPNELTVIN